MMTNQGPVASLLNPTSQMLILLKLKLQMVLFKGIMVLPTATPKFYALISENVWVGFKLKRSTRIGIG